MGGESYNDIVKMKVVRLLQFYGFTATHEAPVRIPEGGWGRVDVAGRKGNITVGVEVVWSGDVARDAKKLAMNNFDYRYIIALQYPKQVDEIIVDGKRIKVVDSIRSFEHELRRDLGIPLDHPYFSQLEKPPEVFIESKEEEINKLIEELEEYGLENFIEEVLDAIRRVYISRKLAVEIRVHYNPMTGPTSPNEYESVNIKPQILSILHKLNFINTSREGRGEGRKTFAYPTERGSRVGHELILKRIKEHERDIERIIKEYGNKLWIILYGSLWYTPNYYSLEIILRDRFYVPRGVILSKEEDPIIKAAKHAKILGRYSDLDLNYLDLPEPPLIWMFSNFLVNTMLKDDAIRLFRELESYDLAIQDTEWDASGFPMYDVIKAPFEVFQYFIQRIQRPGNLRYYAQKFGVFYVLLKVGEIYHPPTARKTYENLLRALELNDSMIAEVLADMNKRGITSRLITDPEKSPFIILDEKGFEEYIKYSLVTIAEHFK
ncbi:hypothetical protein [Pyrococcus abyssi]|uniref:Uncharacterized protein n=1 Tax=Pyrococcus abyssi (strain GE5 / Orsay) TaxID=272844 RepID=Q9UZX8_PYRAB|nr:hypothetical protein [Pyrococcus abyssi]CAB49928.1 Hypothetical protein PAB1693 [Pyrococcus abyssi GE5]CCE70426.1 TPA: hypothetical protein PAB1693 [Pyrococcus abyssi GE5]